MFIGGTVIPASAYQESPVWIPTSSPSGFNPADYGTPILYEDGDDVTGSVGSNVSTWPFNTYGADAIFTTGTNPTKENGPNGHIAVDFGGAAFLTGILSYSGTTLTVVSVMKMRSGTANFGRSISVGTVGTPDFDNTASAAAITRNGTSNELLGYRTAPLSDQSVSLDTWLVAVSEFDGTDHTMTINGSSASPVGSTGSFGIVNFRLGEDVSNFSAFLDGAQTCNIIYSALTDRTGLIAALRAKYGI